MSQNMQDVNMAHHSSKAVARISPERFENFLVSLANTSSRTIGYERDYGPMRRLVEKFREFFPVGFPADSSLSRQRDELHEIVTAGSIQEPRTAVDREEDSLDAFIKWARLLRRAWDEPDSRLKEWWLFELRRDFHAEVNPGSTDPPERTPFEQAIVHLQRKARRAKHCGNPDCTQLPYFIAANSRYRFCCEECAATGQKQHKNAWWAEHGNAWRESRKKSQPKRNRKEN